MKRAVPYIFVAYIGLMILIYPQNAIMSAKSGLHLCYEVIIPSLFPFFVCSGLLIYSGFTKVLAKFSGPLMRPLFNVGGAGSSALILGIVSGYPLGALTACQLYESGYLSKTETERLLAFCNNSGPLFILGAVGSAIYSSVKIGVVLYVSHILSTLLVGFLFRFYARDRHTAPTYTINQTEDGFSQVFSRVLANSVNSILTVSGAVIFFGVVSGVITTHLPFNDAVKSFITGILELTGGTKSISQTALPVTVKLTLSAFVVGFAGICVHIQVAAIVAKYHLSLVPYILGKILHGLFSALFTFLYFCTFPPKISVFKTTSAPLSAGFCMSSMYSVINILFFVILGILVITFTSMGIKQCSKQK
ncbi:MAG: sporulation protein [Clostridia bacterium]|nr:sporulation protein [Clostridia bacterium]